jgi:hypothetical protein
VNLRDMSFIANKPMSLFDLAATKICLSVERPEYVELLECLPFKLRDLLRSRVKSVWLNQGPLLPIEEFDFSEVDISDALGYPSFLHVNMIMNYSLEDFGTPHFILEKLVMWRYFTVYYGGAGSLKRLNLSQTFFNIYFYYSREGRTKEILGIESGESFVMEMSHHEAHNNVSVLENEMKKTVVTDVCEDRCIL